MSPGNTQQQVGTFVNKTNLYILILEVSHFKYEECANLAPLKFIRRRITEMYKICYKHNKAMNVLSKFGRRWSV